MPYSSKEGKDWIKNQITKLIKTKKIKKTGKILDVGVGSGTYQEFYGNILKGDWIGVEVWQPYIEQFKLKKKYTDIIVRDIRKIEWANDDDKNQVYSDREFEVIFLGDVLEHMTKGEAQTLVRYCYNNAKYVFISIPIVKYPQGEYQGNKYETHVKDDWSHAEVLESFDYITDNYKGLEIGVYLINK